jgi:hypothetical protein
MTNYRKHLQGTSARWCARIAPRASDGLATILLKGIVVIPSFLWMRFIFLPVMRRLEAPSMWLSSWLSNTSEAERWWLALDLYKAVMTIALAGCYVLSTWLAGPGPAAWYARPVVVLCSICVILRLIELCTLLMLLFNDPQYRPRSYFRTVANSFWHYLEIVLGFAVLYVTVCVFRPEAICDDHGRSLIATRGAPFYFSTTTIATIGYGDYAPVSSVARMLVIAEAMIGLFLVLTVLPACIARFGMPVSKEVGAEHAQPG